MDKLYSPATMARIRDRHGFKHNKSLGQNFLSEKAVIDDIIDGSEIGPDDLVIEIGPGMGVLTAEAAKIAGKVIAIELDKNLLPILAETLAEFDNVEIINADIMKTDLKALITENFPVVKEAPAAGSTADALDETADGSARGCSAATGAVRIIGNLPYYITTPIVMKLLEDGIPADSITVMMQKEVADRIKALPGEKDCGAITAAVSYYSTVSHIADAPKEFFVPMPKVDSTVLRLDLRKEPPVNLKSEKIFRETVKAGFGQRRKTLYNSLTGLRGLGKETIGEILDATGIDRRRRAETLTLEEFAAIANAVADRV